MTATQIKDAANDTHKHCSSCGTWTALEDFPPYSRGLKGRGAQCRPCWRTYQNTRNKRADVQERRREAERRPHRARQARITLMRRRYGERGAELEQQRLDGYPCEVCGRLLPKMAIDHEHESGKVRGLLCQPCNYTLGRMEENPSYLRSLAAYIEKHSQ